MAKPNQRKQDKARHKHKVKRQAAQTARKKRTQRVSQASSHASSWPLGDAYVSDTWHEWEAVVHGVISRTHADGTSAFAVFTVELADNGLQDLQLFVGLPQNQVGAWAATKTSEDSAMITVEPEAVKRLLVDGLTLRRKRGAADPRDLGKVLDMFADVDADDSPFDYHLGFEADDEPTVEVKRGLFASIKGLFGASS